MGKDKPPPGTAPTQKVSADMRALINAIHAQTEAINNLVISNAEVIQCFADAMAEEEGEESQTQYLDGAEIQPGL